MVCPHGQGEEGFEPERTFFGKGGVGQFFCDLTRTSFMDGPLQQVNQSKSKFTLVILISNNFTKTLFVHLNNEYAQASSVMQS